MKRMLVLTAVALMASAAWAQPYYVRGDFNGWTNSTDPMIDMGGGMYSYTVTGLTPGVGYEYKATVDDWSFNAPGSNAKTPADAAGEINVNFFPNNVWADGWMPDAKPRLGWQDPGTFDWELVGDMNGWAGGAAWYLTDMGNGLHVGEFALNAGTYQFKFRQQGDWAYSIGDDLGNAAANNSLTVANDGDIYRFEIDLPNGRWRTTLVPEPATMIVMLLGGLFTLRRR